MARIARIAVIAVFLGAVLTVLTLVMTFGLQAIRAAIPPRAEGFVFGALAFVAILVGAIQIERTLRS